MAVRSRGFKEVFARLIRRAARLAGCELIPCWRLDNLALATHLRELFARLAIDCVLDVGANRGQYGRFLRREVGYTGYITSCEPQAACLRDLEARARGDALWKIFATALGSQSGQLPINVTHLNTVVQVEMVPVKRLDEIADTIRQESGCQSMYLKLDTQGYDLEVIKGASAALGSVAALQTEVSVLPIYGRMPDWLTSLQTLKERSFDVTGIFPVSQDPDLRVVEFDCVAVNTAFRPSRPTTLAKMAGRTETGASRGAPVSTKASGDQMICADACHLNLGDRVDVVVAGS